MIFATTGSLCCISTTFGTDNDQLALAKRIRERAFRDEGKFSRRWRRWWRRRRTGRRTIVIIVVIHGSRPAADGSWIVIAFFWIVESGVVVNEVVNEKLGLADSRAKPASASAHLCILHG
jgi:hypothetical protein